MTISKHSHFWYKLFLLKPLKGRRINTWTSTWSELNIFIKIKWRNNYTSQIFGTKQKPKSHGSQKTNAFHGTCQELFNKTYWDHICKEKAFQLGVHDSRNTSDFSKFWESFFVILRQNCAFFILNMNMFFLNNTHMEELLL